MEQDSVAGIASEEYKISHETEYIHISYLWKS